MKNAAIGIATLAGIAVAAPALAGSGDLRSEILQAYEVVNRAVETADSATLKAKTTADHVSVTSRGQEDTALFERVGDAGLTNFKRDIVSDVVIEELAPGLVLQRFDAEMQGSFAGKPVPERAVVTIIWQQHDGQWLERYYQHTPLG